MSRWIWFPLALVAGAFYAAPRIMRRAFAPPQRDIPHTPTDLGLPEEQVWLESVNGTRLHGWFIPVDGAAPAVVVLHGWGGNAAHMLEIAPGLHEAGFHALFLDARSHGLSENDDYASQPRFSEDLAVAVAYLHERSDVAAVGVIGHSVGAAAAIYHASEHHDIDALVAVSSYADPGEMMEANFGLPAPVTWSILRGVEMLIGRPLHEVAPRERIGLIDLPLMLVHGDADEVVTVDDSIELAALSPQSKLVVVPGGTHSDLEPFAPFFPDVMAFLQRHLKAEGVAAEAARHRDDF